MDPSLLMTMASLRSLSLFALCLMPASAETVLVHGHRGSRATRTENTLPAFEFAIAHGADVLELDLAVTKDNVLVVSHDPTIPDPAHPDGPGQRICIGPKVGVPIHTLTLLEIKQYDCGTKKNPVYPDQVAFPGTRIPTFDEVLDLAPRGKFEFNVETKIFPDKPGLTPSPEVFTKLVLDAIRRHHLESRVILQSFDFRTLRVMKKLDPSIRRSALIETLAAGQDFVSVCRDADCNIISPLFRLVTPDRVAAAHAAGIQVVPWTADKPEDWKKLVDAKVDAIISDDPAALIAWLKALPTPLH